MDSENTLILTFITENGGKEKVRIRNAKDTLDSSIVTNLSNAIITNNIFFSNTGDLIELENATLEKLVKEEIL